MEAPHHPSSQPPRRRRILGRVLAWGILLGAVLAVGWATGCMERLFYYPTGGATPAPRQFIGAESVWFESADGIRLHGWFIPAQDRRVQPHLRERAQLEEQHRPPEPDLRAPTILHVHGNAGNITSHLYFTEYLPAAGFNVFLFDYRGYGQSEGSAQRRADLIADTEAALETLLARPDVDPERIGMYGQSLGGSIGLNVMVRREEIKAAVIFSAFTSWREIAADVVGGGKAGIFSRSLASILIRDHRRPIDAIARIDRPILLLHGDGDRTVPVHHSRRLAAASPTAKLIILPGGDHNSMRDTHPEVDGLTVEFFRASLRRGD